ncbi:MAG: alpha/beta hydrolase [Rhodanobacter sp.]
MNTLRLLLILLVLVSIASVAGAAAPPKLLSWSELSAMPLPTPAKRITYGGKPQQFGELRLPKGRGPFPVVVLVHGGCWMAAYDYVYMTRLAAWLAQRGVATWSIEFRRVGDDGGSWPGTFLDVANATDDLRDIAKTEPIDLKHIYAAGHSAGGQLALWLSMRTRLPRDSELYRRDPLPIRGVLALAAVTDLYEYRKGSPDSCHGSVDQVMGGSPQKYPRRYAETSPRQLLPLGVPQVFIQGADDPIVDPAPVRAYVEAAKKAGDRAQLLTLPNAGHFEASVPLPQTQAVFEKALHWLLQSDATAR